MNFAIRAAGPAALAAVVIGAAAVVQGCGGNGSGSDREPASAVSESPQRSVPVPELVGLTEADAVRALGASGLVANVRFEKETPRTGKVLSSEPAAGSEVRPQSVVVLKIALPPRRPTPGPDEEQELRPFNTMIEANPDAFVGLYRDEEGIPHAVFGPGTDPAAWRGRLAAAAEGLPYRTDTCSQSYAELRALQDEIAAKRWTRNKELAFGVYVHPASCTVRVESDLLTEADIRALADRYGTAISIDTTEGSHPILLGP